jgi:hypothetical protein
MKLRMFSFFVVPNQEYCGAVWGPGLLFHGKIAIGKYCYWDLRGKV